MYGVFFVYIIIYITVKVFFIVTGPDLFTEEAQYWVWSQHLDWSYYSKPPLIAWVNYLAGIISQSDYIIRASALFFGIGILYMIFRLTLLLFQEPRIALMSVVLLSVSPFFTMASTFFTTDTLLIFFWTACFYFFFLAETKNNLIYWILAGVCFGLGCLSKYTMFFFLFAFIPWVLIQMGPKPYQRFLLFVTIGFLFFMPVVIWNYQHDWVSLKHLSGLTGFSQSFFSWKESLKFLSEYIGGVVLFNSPFFVILFTNKKYREKLFNGVNEEDRNKLLLLNAPLMGTLLIFLFLSFFIRTEVNWPSMSYIGIPVTLAYGIEKSGFYRQALVASIITFAFLLIFLFPPWIDRAGLTVLMPPKTDSMKRLAGWEELSEKVMEVRNGHPAYGPILTDSYHVASELSFYTKSCNIYCLNIGRRMNQFDIWGGLEDLRDNSPLNAIYISDSDTSQKSLIFDSIDTTYTFPVFYRGELIKKYQIYLLSNYRFQASMEFTEF